MRFQEFTVRIPDGEFRLHFHDRVTVVSGIGEIERTELLHSMTGALVGLVPGTGFVYLDGLGRGVTVNGDTGSAAVSDGSFAPGILEVLGETMEGLIRTLRVDGGDLGLRPGHQHLADHPELLDARTALDSVTSELHAALNAHQASEAMRDEIAELDERIRRAADNRDRRAYARVLARLEQLRAEYAAAQSGPQGVNDLLVLDRREAIASAAARWRDTLARLESAGREFGDRDPLPDDERDAAIAFPDTVPTTVHDLADRVAALEAERDQLQAQLRTGAAATLPEPSDPTVTALAAIDQASLWAANDALFEAHNQVRSLSIGVSADLSTDEFEAAVEELEGAHRDLEFALEEIEEGGVRKIMAQRRAHEAEKRESAALARLGLPTYLSLHIRRLEATLDPDVRARAEQAEAAERLAYMRWRDLAGAADPFAAAGLRDEVAAYAEAVSALDGHSDEISRLRKRLEREVLPQLETAVTELAEACRPFGLDDVAMAVEMVRHQAERGRTARLQLALDAARTAESKAALALSDALFDVGFGDGDVDARLGAYDWAVERAVERTSARSTARDPETIAAEIAELERETARLRRPEWNDVSPDEAAGPDLEALELKRQATVDALHTTSTLLPDLERLRDRHKALTRRVDVLERDLRSRGLLGDSTSQRAAQALLARLTAARTAGPDGSALPVVIDDALRLLDIDEKAEVLELVERLSEKVQVIYLTDDETVSLWARRRAATGELTLLEPMTEDVTV